MRVAIPCLYALSCLGRCFSFRVVSLLEPLYQPQRMTVDDYFHRLMRLYTYVFYSVICIDKSSVCNLFIYVRHVTV